MTVSVPLAAQETATVRGRLIDDETGEAVAGAVVRIKGMDPVTAGENGGFLIIGVRIGQVELTFLALGYEGQTHKFQVIAGQTVNQVWTMTFTGDRLPDVEVQARAQRIAPRYADFERRREVGLGTYLRWDEIKARGSSTVGDALRTVRGVRIDCDQQRFECFVKLSRSPHCFPAWYIDGTRVRSFHENTSIRDVYGIEVYRGAGEVPGDFGGSDAGCGVIVLWTKSRPYR